MEFKTKFGIGQEVYYLDDECSLIIKSGKVDRIVIEANDTGGYKYEYNMGDEYFVPEDEICESKEEAEKRYGVPKLI